MITSVTNQVYTTYHGSHKVSPRWSNGLNMERRGKCPQELGVIAPHPGGQGWNPKSLAPSHPRFRSVTEEAHTTQDKVKSKI